MLVVPTLRSRDGHRLLPDFLRPQRLGKISEDQTGSSPQGSGWKWEMYEDEKKKTKEECSRLTESNWLENSHSFCCLMLFPKQEPWYSITVGNTRGLTSNNRPLRPSLYLATFVSICRYGVTPWKSSENPHAHHYLFVLIYNLIYSAFRNCPSRMDSGVLLVSDTSASSGMLESPLKATFHGMFRPLENVTDKLREALLCNPKMEVWICVKLLPNWIRNSTTSGRWL